MQEVIKAIVAAGGAEAQSFFLEVGLGRAYASVSQYDKIQARVNAALLRAEHDGNLHEVIEQARERFMKDSVGSPSLKRRVADKPVRNKLFISHASADKELADRLVDLIQLGTNLSNDLVLCTSLEGLGIPEGERNYIEYLRTELVNAKLVLPLLTPAYFDSEMCLVELGGLWALDELETFPLLVKPIDYARLEKLLGKVQSAKIDSTAGLSRLHDRIVKLFGLSPKTDRWEIKRTRFMDELDDVLSRLSSPKRVPAKDLTAAQQALKNEKLRHTRTKQKLAETEQQRDQLKELKDPVEVNEILISGDEEKAFEQLSTAAKVSVARFSRVVQQALYEDIGNNELLRIHPLEDRDSSEAAQAAVRRDELKYDDDESGYYPNRDDESITEAFEAITDLFEYKWSDHFLAAWAKDHKKKFKSSSLPVWEALGLMNGRL